MRQMDASEPGRKLWTALKISHGDEQPKMERTYSMRGIKQQRVMMTRPQKLHDRVRESVRLEIVERGEKKRRRRRTSTASQSDLRERLR